MSSTTIHHLLSFLERLRAAHIHYTLSDPTQGAIMVDISVPGERWEVEFHEDGLIGVEVFASVQGVQGAELLNDLFRRFSNWIGPGGWANLSGPAGSRGAPSSPDART